MTNMTTPPIARSKNRMAMARTLVAAVALASAGAVIMVPTAEASGSAGGAGGAASAKRAQCTGTDVSTAGVKVAVSDVPKTVAVTNTLGSTAVVTVTFGDKGSTFTLSSASPSVRLTDASWCVTSTAASAPVSGTGLTGTSPAATKKDKAHRIGSVTLYSVTATHLLGGSTPTCYGSTTGLGDDISWDGAGGDGVLGNAVDYDSTDGSCSGGDPYAITIVRGETEAEALDNCGFAYQDQDSPLVNVENLAQEGYGTAPTDLWRCFD